MVELNAAPKLTVREIRLFERDVVLRLPFRFGVVTLTAAPQCFARARVRLADGRESWGMAAEMLAPKWFDKNLALSNEDNFDQLRQALAIVGAAYVANGAKTAFGHFAEHYEAQIAAGRTHDLEPLVAGFGPALVDRAVLDGVCRATQVSFYDAVRHNLAGIRGDALTPDLAGFDVSGFLEGLRPPGVIHARHTVGMVDPLDENPTPVGDGLPETLSEIIEYYGIRYFKVKVGGDREADLERLSAIAVLLDKIEDRYYVTLDGNEQYADQDGVLALWQAILGNPELERFAGSIIMIEQPIARGLALATNIDRLAEQKPVIIDESDGEIDAFPRARALGYHGVSSKSCKGLYKSILNAARCRHWNDQAGAERYFMSGEDLTTQAGVSVQQDLALAGLIGIAHVERNGHHYVNGMSGVSEREQQDFVEAHPDLYHRGDGVTRLRIRNGEIAVGSLERPGFAVGAEPDWGAMRDAGVWSA